LIHELATHALTRKGARDISRWEEPEIELPGAGTFLRVVETAGQYFARVPIFQDALNSHSASYPVLRKVDWPEKDGHVHVDVPLNAMLPAEFLKMLIDAAYTGVE